MKHAWKSTTPAGLCLSHTILRELAPFMPVNIEVPYQVRFLDGSWSKQRNLDDDLALCGLEQPFCKNVLKFLTWGDSVHVAPYRKVAPDQKMLIWLDLDDMNRDGRYRDLPIWWSRRDCSRGHAVFPVYLPGWTYPGDILKAYQAEYCSDPAAAHLTHGFRLPGFSSYKDGADENDYMNNAVGFLEAFKNGKWVFPESFLAVANRFESSCARASSSDGGLAFLGKAVLNSVKTAWTKGQRHRAALALAGICRKAGLTREQAEDIMREVAQGQGDEEVHLRLLDVKDTYDKPEDQVAGVSLLVRLK